MWAYIRIIIMSLFLIFLIQFFTTYIKNIFFQNKTKDIIGYQTQKYKEIVSNMCSQQPPFREPEQIKKDMEEINFIQMENELTEMFFDKTRFATQEQLF